MSAGKLACVEMKPTCSVCIQRHYDFDILGVIELDTRTMLITSIGTERMSPEQYKTEVIKVYQGAFTDGLAEAQKRYDAGNLPYPLDMPRQLQVGSYADGSARRE